VTVKDAKPKTTASSSKKKKTKATAKKKVTAKKAATKTAAKKKAPKKPTARKKAAIKKVRVTAATTAVNPEERYKMIAEAAFLRAERRGFVDGDDLRDWLDAEREIDQMLETQ